MYDSNNVLLLVLKSPFLPSWAAILSGVLADLGADAVGKRQRSDLHVVQLDLAHVHRLVPHKLCEFDLEFFHLPVCVHQHHKCTNCYSSAQGKMSRGLKSPSGGRLPALKGCMNDVTSVLQTAPCYLSGWARVKIKPAKSRSRQSKDS